MSLGYEVDRLKRLLRWLANIGTDGTVLTADAASDMGVKWAPLFPLPATVWCEIQGWAAMANTDAALTVDACGDAGFYGYCMSSEAPDTLYYEFEMPPRWKPQTEVKVHITITPLANPAAQQGVRLTYAYAWAMLGVTTPKPATWTASAVTHTVAVGDIDKPRSIALFASTPGAAYTHGSLLLVKVSRLTTHADDNYVTQKTYGTVPKANLQLHAVGVHYQTDVLGSATDV